MANAPWTAALLRMTRDGPDFVIKITVPLVQRLEDQAAAKGKATRAAKRSPNIRKERKERKEAKIDHDRGHEIHRILVTSLPLVDEAHHVVGAAQAPPVLVHLGSKTDLNVFVYFPTMGSATNRLKIAPLFTIPHANSILLPRDVETETNVYHLTVRKVALWLCDLFSAK